MDIEKELFALQDLKFRDFCARLIPNVDKEKIIGIKTSKLKALAKDMIKRSETEKFLKQLPHKYLEENQIHAFIISEIRELDKTLLELEKFLPYVDNWATCDQLIPKAIAKNPELILEKVDLWLKSNKTYTVRFGMGILMRYFLNERFDKIYLEKVAKVESKEYYINMMSAWYFATALAKQYEETVPYLMEYKLDKWVHNKSISKARESRRVSEEHKEELKKLIIK